VAEALPRLAVTGGRTTPRLLQPAAA